MIVEEMKRQQQQALEEFRRMKQKDPDRARRMALSNLQSAKILDKNGELAERYR